MIAWTNKTNNTYATDYEFLNKVVLLTQRFPHPGNSRLF